MVRGKYLALGLAALLSAGCAHTKGASTIPSIPPTSIDSVVEIYENSLPVSQSVIESTKSSTVRVDVIAHYSGEFPEMGVVTGTASGSGSGIVIAHESDNYYILTAHHVINAPSQLISPFGPIDKISEASISLEGVEGATVVSFDAELDYALLEIPIAPQFGVYEGKIGRSERIRSGDILATIGFSLALDKYFSVGTITDPRHPERLPTGQIFYDNDGFGFDAAISPGNSGGPLFTVSDGELYLVGIAHAYIPEGEEMYIGKKIKPILKDIKKKGIDLNLDYDTRTVKNFYSK